MSAQLLPPADRLAPLRQHATGQAGVFTRQQALAAGWTPSEIVTHVRRTRWVACGAGAYCIAADSDPRYLPARRCAARRLRLGGDVVVSHASAAVLLGLPHVEEPATPTFTLARSGPVVHRQGIYTAAVPDEHRLRMHGLVLTNGPRTFVDLLRNASDEYVAQGLADGGLSAGLTAYALAPVLASCERWPGIAQARAALEFGEPLCETPLESRCRLWFRAAGLPAPTPQHLIRLPRGKRARVDFCFVEHRVVVEADGRVKYSDGAPWRRADDVPLWDEKLREDQLRDLGFEVVRAYWRDGDDGGVALTARVRRAMDRAAARR